MTTCHLGVLPKQGPGSHGTRGGARHTEMEREKQAGGKKEDSPQTDRQTAGERRRQTRGLETQTATAGDRDTGTERGDTEGKRDTGASSHREGWMRGPARSEHPETQTVTETQRARAGPQAETPDSSERPPREGRSRQGARDRGSRAQRRGREPEPSPQGPSVSQGQGAVAVLTSPEVAKETGCGAPQELRGRPARPCLASSPQPWLPRPASLRPGLSGPWRHHSDSTPWCWPWCWLQGSDLDGAAVWKLNVPHRPPEDLRGDPEATAVLASFPGCPGA